MVQRTPVHQQHASMSLVPPTLDGKTAERVTQWVTRWHGADYEIEDISEMLEEWPADIPLADLIEPFGVIDELQSAESLSYMVLELIHGVERGRIQTTQARGAFRFACRQLCTRGVPFEETAKGDETALWFHFIGMNEFGDADNHGFATDFSELRLMSRYLIDPDRLLRELLDGEFPGTFHEGYVSIAGALADRRLVPYLVRILRRSEDVQQVAQVINVLGRLGDNSIVPLLEGYAFSTSDEIAATTAVSLEALGGDDAIAILERVTGVLPRTETPLAAHARYALTNLREGSEALLQELHRVAADSESGTVYRLAAIERLAIVPDVDTIRLLANLLDDPTYERVSVDGLLTDDVVYTIREAAYLALIDRRINTLVHVLGEEILDRLESFQLYSAPSWWAAGMDHTDFGI
jgi:hypothetical protein